jgi:hypothetical protein
MDSADTLEFDQAMLYIERLPNTVQRDHIDWGFRLSGLYGENYRYTTSLGIATYQLQKLNNVNGFPDDVRGIVHPVDRARLADPRGAFHLGAGHRSPARPEQLHVLPLLHLRIRQLVVDGTEVALWVPRSQDPGKQASLEACVRWTSDTDYDNVYVYVCANGINNGTWGYNNLQWYGFTYYHKFNEGTSLRRPGTSMRTTCPTSTSPAAAVGTRPWTTSPGVPNCSTTSTVSAPAFRPNT